ncbi:hypothetical protein NDU88_003587 [Pleurodeles waltl]|uniref:Uncharacterized protein n=1 Tax=Pleurodeles waltl TaxID=8319 RepID=A0AAV7UD25_PLEWA|nr:hypothetical protein NDU88_003587 [Pleurodeles waltl]
MDAATTVVQRKDTEGERVFKPMQDKRREGGFSPGGEDVATTQNRRTRPEPKPERRPGLEEALSKPGGQPEEGDWEERRSEQTSHFLGRA